MWVFAKNGFLSIVQSPDNKLLVRARVRGDIQRYFPGAKVFRTPDHDYMYRATMNVETVAARIATAVRAIDYDTFKSSIADKRRKWAYADVWGRMQDLQWELSGETEIAKRK